MTSIIKIHRLCLLLFLIALAQLVFAADANGIKVNSETNTLVAPEGCHYQWYHNNEAVNGGNGQELKVTEAGLYTVEVLDMKGTVSTTGALIAISGTGAIIKIYIIGDSTVCNYASSAYPQTGWGQVLPFFFNSSNIQVDNRAIGGRSSRSFYEQGRWTPIKDVLAPGDYVFIQFGHNDRDVSHADRYTSVTDYKKYLTIYCNDAKAKKAIPVLVSPMVMNAWNGTTMRNVFTESGNDYRGAMLEVATKLNVAFVDLNMKSWNLYKSLGKDYITRFVYHTYVAGEYPNYPNGNTDGTHFQEMGAIENARMVVQGVSELSSRADMANLIHNIRPQQLITVAVNPSNTAQITTRSATYPEGLTVTLKTLPGTGSKFQHWTNASGTQIATTTMTRVKSGNTATKYTVIYAGAATCTAAISASGSTSICQGDKLTLTASAGTGYVWRKDGTTVGTAATYSPIASGSYTVEVTNASNCKAVSSPVTVTVTPAAAWYADADKDGKGDPNQVKFACLQPAGYVADHSDQCPTDPLKATPGNCGCGRTEQSCVDCNNVPNGSAAIDACGICTGGNTGRAACTTAEAEAVVCAYDGVPETVNAGFKGASYINGINVKGAKFSIAVNSVNAVNAMLAFRYACGSPTNRYAKVVVNGDTLAQLLSFPSTGNFTTWKTAALSAPLRAGNNSITLVANTNEGLVNIDEIQYLTPGTSNGTCAAATKMGDDSANNTLYYPNPYTEALMLPEGGDYTLYDLGGNVVERGSCKQSCEAGKGLPAGVYLLELHKDTWSVRTKVTKQ